MLGAEANKIDQICGKLEDEVTVKQKTIRKVRNIKATQRDFERQLDNNVEAAGLLVK
jgi:hypothetical protein